MRPRRTGLLYPAISVLLLLAGCTSHPDPEAFAIEPDQFYRAANTIVLTPATLPGELASYAARAVEFDSLIASALEQSGLNLVPAYEYSALWETVMERAGGFFDPITGERDEQKFTLARDSLFGLLQELYAPDALLYPEVWIVGAPFAGGVAQWDGTSQALIGLGSRILDALGAVLGQSESNLPEGTVDALSLVVFVEDIEGMELYANSGGIQVLQKVGRDPDDVTIVSGEEILSDHDRNRRAVWIALEPLLTALHARTERE